MSSTPPSGGRLFVESLEARIAPTGLTGIANLLSSANDPNYVAYSTVPQAGSKLGFVNAQVPQYGIGNGNIYALALSGPAGDRPGDKLIIYRPVGGLGDENTFIQATAGNLVAFFQDKNLDGQVQTNELVGVSMAKKSGLFVFGNVDGDIVTNLSNTGTLTPNSVGKASFKITSLDITGNVNGNVLAGGDLGTGDGAVTIRGSVHNVLVGTAANGATYNFTGTAGAVSGTIANVPLQDGKIGPSINGLTLVALTPQGKIQAGDGGFGAVGGSVNDVTFLGDTDAFSVFGGKGGVGSGTLKGSVGGSIDNLLINGVANSVANHLITIQAGQGGDNSTGKGGVGGLVNGVFTSLNNPPSASNQSADLLAQNLYVAGGAGGNGVKGGNGGDVINSVIFGSIPDDGVASSPEIQVLGGHGGLNLTTGVGKGGNGGLISQVDIRNFDALPEADASSILVHAGDAGVGKVGGNVEALSVLGRNAIVSAGDGGSGPGRGGDGGSLEVITVRNLTNLFAASVTLNAGQGGNGGSGVGGNGGNVDTVRMIDSDLISTGTAPALVINGGTHGNGGNSAGSTGGSGGSVLNVQLNTSGFSAGLAGTTAGSAVRSGLGGNGELGGGFGGDITQFQFTGTGFSAAVTAGAGGSINPGGAGDGGGGGNLTQVGVSNIPDIANFPATDPILGTATVVLPAASTGLIGLTGSAVAGAGGAGTVNGGAGGVLSLVNYLTGGSIAMRAGDGGSGGSGQTGAGGSVSSSGASSLVGSVSLTSGSAGLGGSIPGDGGEINGFVATASAFLNLPGNIAIRAGDGHTGGAGGSILAAGTNLNQLNNLPNLGSTTIRAGNGSDGNGQAGAGGDITTINGYIGLSGNTTLTAGNGGGSAGSPSVGAGGSITGISLKGASNQAGITTAQTVFIDAGGAGLSGVAKKGAAGGSVTSVILYNLDLNTVVHHVAAGSGSGGTKKGGSGGSIESVHVGTAGDVTADIGIRTGVASGYGFDRTTAGGLFAGVGAGAGAFNGNVIDVTANAISSIVAGTNTRPELVNLVDQVKLAGQGNAPRANANGSFINLATANFVGSVVNPTAAGAGTYKAGDGIVAALNFSQDRNFRPEALLTLDANGNRVLADYREPALGPVTTTAPSNLL